MNWWINKGILIYFKKITYNTIILKDKLNLQFKRNNNYRLNFRRIIINRYKHLN